MSSARASRALRRRASTRTARPLPPLPRQLPRLVVRREAGLYAYEKVLGRAGLTPVAGADEAGRGACAGPLVVAAVVLPTGARGVVPGLADSKLLTAAARERVYAEVVRRAVSWSAVVIPPGEVDRIGLHVANVQGMRRALTRLSVTPAYVLTDGFPIAGLPAPALAVWKGDRVSASIAAASVVAKVTRDRIMCGLHEQWPSYDFAGHKGYVTPVHNAALDEVGPCPEHRFSYVNVARRAWGDRRIPIRTTLRLAAGADTDLDRDLELDEGVVDVQPIEHDVLSEVAT